MLCFELYRLSLTVRQRLNEGGGGKKVLCFQLSDSGRMKTTRNPPPERFYLAHTCTIVRIFRIGLISRLTTIFLEIREDLLVLTTGNVNLGLY